MSWQLELWNDIGGPNLPDKHKFFRNYGLYSDLLSGVRANKTSEWTKALSLQKIYYYKGLCYVIERALQKIF